MPAPPAAGSIDAQEKADGTRALRTFPRLGGVRVIAVAPGESVPAAIARLRATGRYAFVEPDYMRRPLTAPNDPGFPNQWGLSNDGSQGGIAGADIHAEGGWSIRTDASSVIVAMIDSGALTTHEDLAANLWTNPSPGTTASYASLSQSTGAADSVSETDSLNGLDAVDGSGPPTDTVGHGTLTSGVVGAVANNAKGVAGVAWKTQLMELRFIGSEQGGSISDELPCIEYAIAHSAKVVNASYGDTNYSQAEMTAIYNAGQAGIIFVCAAGNDGDNIDVSPFFPADYPLDNLVTVGSSGNRDLPSFFSNHASGSVELFAPGEGIYSTDMANNSSYAYANGTSLAAPFVTGAAALLRAQFPSDSYRQTINRLLNGVDRVGALAGQALTGGRLDLAASLSSAPNTAPNGSFATRYVLVGDDPYVRANNVDTPLALEAGAPPLASGSGHALWWQWTAPADAAVEIDTSGTGEGMLPGGSTIATGLAVYTGSSLASLSLVAGNNGAGTEPPIGGGAAVPYSKVQFHAAAGTVYQINVQGLAGASGQVILAVNTTPDNDSFSSALPLAGASVSVMGVNVNASRQAGEPVILGSGGGHSLWYSWTAPSGGTVQVSGYAYDLVPKVAVYSGTSLTNLQQLASAQGSAASGTYATASGCLCTFTASAGATYMIAVDGATSGDVGAFTLTVDDSLWQAQTGDSVTCTPAAGPDGTIYVGSEDKALYAFNPDGSQKWKLAESSAFDTSSAAVGADGTLYAANVGGQLFAVGPSGAVNWTYAIPGLAGASTTGNSISASPAIAPDGTVYVHSTDGNLYAVAPAGVQKWAAPVPGFSYAAPTLAPDGTIYVATDGGLVVAVNPDGSQKWQFTSPVAGEPFYTAAPVDSSGNLYVASLSGNVYSLTGAGRLRWTFSVGNSVSSAPALANGSVYFGGYDGFLYALSASDGSLRWKYAMGGQVRASAPAVDANGTVYVGSYDHNVYAVSPSGTLVRTYATSDSVRSSPLLSGGSLYFGSNDHKLYAFAVGVPQAAGDWPMYQFGPQRQGRRVSAAPAIATQPASTTVAAGSPFTLSVAATGLGTLAYQWYLDGAVIVGATGSSYAVSSASASDAGVYTVTVTDPSGTLTSAGASVTVLSGAAAASRLANHSARAAVGQGAGVLIAGFVIAGPAGKSVVLRGVGPALSAAPFNVAGTLALPELTLTNSATGQTIASGQSWGGSAALAAEFKQVGAFALAPGSADAAVAETLPAGSYTSVVSGVGSDTGVALAEIYDADPAGSASTLLNISARAQVGTGGAILIAGFVIEGTQPMRVLLRGIGPTLGTSFGVSGALALPQIQLFDASGSMIGSNAGWGSNSELPSASSAAGAFPLPTGSADAAMIQTLNPGSYTLQLSGQGTSTGVGLVEVYALP